MRKTFKRIALALIIGFSGLLLASGDAIGDFASGDTIVIRAYCNTEDVAAIRAFTDALVRDGMKVYWEFMRLPQSPCYDARIHSNPVISVELLKKLWVFELPSGERLEMWQFRDKADQLGFTWLAIHGEVI